MNSTQTKRAIVLGASSGIGRALALRLSQAGYTVGLTGRREEMLLSLQAELPRPSYVQRLDITCTQELPEQLSRLVSDMGGLDLLVINSGTGFVNPDLDWAKEQTTIDVNVSGFCAAANFGIKHFMNQSSGHLVAISSVAALRGSRFAPAYNASKAFISNYIEGLKQKMMKLRLPISVTDIKPGFVDTAMGQGDMVFWVASPEVAAEQIYQAIVHKKSHAYVTRRWRLIAWLLKCVPRPIFVRL